MSEVAAILLAAGRSSRFGDADKLLAELDGEPLVLHAARRIVELVPAHKIAVCSVDGGVARLLAPLGFEIVYNPTPEEGLSTSLAYGIAAAGQGGFPAALVCLADMPFVSLRHLNEILAHFDPVDAPVVASMVNGIAMPPAIFSDAYFDRLRSGKGDRGARAFLASATHVAATCDELADIDTVGDFAAFTDQPK